MKKLVVGLDVGIASVGWGILDIESGQVVDCGVRLFPEGDSKSNTDRREKRGSRRLIRRREHRLERIKRILIENEIIYNNFKPLDDPYSIRVKGLKNKLSNEELATAILHIAKRRGVSGDWTISDDTKKQSDDEKTKGVLSQNDALLKDKYICEVQLERFKNNYKIRGLENSFKTADYIKELKQIFSNQNLNQELQDKIIKIIETKREYYEGPGSEKSPTQYGRYQEIDGNIVKIDLIEKMRGKCSVYPSELRAPAMSYSACLFNFLNDLNNLKIGGEHISSEIKKKLINNYIIPKGSLTVNQLQKELDIDNPEEIKGFRIDKNNKPVLTSFPGYKKLLDLVKKEQLNKQILENKKDVDRIIEVLTSKKGVNERKETLLSEFSILTNKEAEELANLSGITGYHSNSLKLIYELLDDLMETEYNQMQLLQQNNYFSEKHNYFGLKNIPFNDELILSATARRSQREAIKVLNAIRNKYDNIDSIVIEMAREKNSDDRKDAIRKRQKVEELSNRQAESLAPNKKLNNLTKIKIKLYMEQNCKTAYSNEEIDLNLLISDPTAYEIDHIIPLSISLDDSLKNKVLVSRMENQNKGQRSPYQFMKAGLNKISYEEFKQNVLSNKNYHWKKKYNLLNEEDINKFSVRKEFINRNLVDTRYATKGLLNTIQAYLDDNELATKVYTINGQITNLFRKRIHLKKERELDSSHHAVDALIVAGLKKMKYLDELMNVKIDAETGEITSLKDDKQLFDEKFINFIVKLDEVNPKFSHKVDRKYNRGLSDETIYSTRIYNDKEYVIAKYKDIYSSTGEKVADLFRNNKATNLLVYKNDIETYNLLQCIVEQYSAETNPFQKYYSEHGFIRKKSKKGNGPIIKDLKYIDGQMGNNIMDITAKYNENSRRVVKLQLSPYRNDIYEDVNGNRKMLLVNQSDVCFMKDKIYIEEEKYNSLKEKYGIMDDYKFKFSLYRNDIIKINNEIVRYAGIKSISSGSIYYKMMDDSKIKNEDDKIISRPYVNIKKLEVFEKYHTDILGNLYKSKDETCKLEIPML